MAKVRLELGAEFDLLTKSEMADVLAGHGTWEREAAFGLKDIRLPRMTGVIDGGDVAIGGDAAPGVAPCGPRQGWCWKVERISVSGIAGTSDFLTIWQGDPSAGDYVTTIGSGAYHPGKGLILHPGEYITLAGTGLTSTGALTVTGRATQVPAPLIWKLIS
jgi:hypothetical protein